MINFANFLTISRIVATPLLVLLMLADFPMAMWTALALYIVIALTDWLDGHIARAYNQGSDFGRVMDPIADKILVAAMFVALAANHVISGWWLALPVLILIREFMVAGLREYLGSKKITVHVSKLAKWKTTTQMIALGFLVAGRDIPDAQYCGLLLLALATILTIVTGWDYARGAKGHFAS
ncbi:MAG: CDP-diacylglycerol--glycerol-3-phosphate 3-phosphatidyltransferase [Micavibrio sp.]|nr:CDP-diacylglycerol--glycerol-3-phosphate 3-phosphatidyltransferase [Micavibrio sp.]